MGRAAQMRGERAGRRGGAPPERLLRAVVLATAATMTALSFLDG